MASPLPPPYEYERADRWQYTFVNRDGVHYKVYFSPMSVLYPQFLNTYSFSIEAVERLPHPMDRRIAATVVDILRRFFQRNEHAMIMVCDSIDGKERKRKMLFDRWFDLYNEGVLSRVDASRSSHDFEMFVTLYYMESNPDKNELLEAFRELMSNDLYEIVI